MILKAFRIIKNVNPAIGSSGRPVGRERKVCGFDSRQKL